MLNEDVTISLDLMGGDHSPNAGIEGLDIFLRSNDNCGKIKFLLYGQGLKELLSTKPRIREVSTVIEAEDVILPSDKPSSVLRKKRLSSMHLAIASVKEEKSNAVISPGNTGALMAISLLELRTLVGICRPAIIAMVPNSSGGCFSVLDLGANIGVDADSLVQFAIMGRAFSKVVLKTNDPRIALLNIGEEETKGTDSIREAHHILSHKDSGLRFVGYIEPDKAFKGNTDVVVTDGFCGNVFLKTVEGFSHELKSALRSSINKSLKARLLAPFLKTFIRDALSVFNPGRYNGGMLIGLNGIVVKSHGSADASAFCSAIKITVDMVKNEINSQIMSEINNFNIAAKF